MQDELRNLWNTLDSTVNLVLDNEGCNMENGQIRYVHNNVWLYVDDVDGFLLMTDDEAGSLCADLEP